MQVLVSDSSVLIEFSKQNLLDRMFELRFQFAVPDLLFNEELIDLGRYHRQDLVSLGLRVEALDPEGRGDRNCLSNPAARPQPGGLLCPGPSTSPGVHPSDRRPAHEILRPRRGHSAPRPPVDH